jgi:TfoX/Sxy family transcriptional regulator of competence genes
MNSDLSIQIPVCRTACYCIKRRGKFNNMSTTIDFIEFVCEQIRGVGDVCYKKMFGEYMVYVNDKPILLVCDNTVFVKMLPEIEDFMEDSEKGFPYESAKEHYIVDIDDAEFSKRIIEILEPITPLPKPRKKKSVK